MEEEGAPGGAVPEEDDAGIGVGREPEHSKRETRGRQAGVTRAGRALAASVSNTVAMATWPREQEAAEIAAAAARARPLPRELVTTETG